MKSNSIYTLFIRHIFLLPALAAFGTGLKGYFVEESIVVNGELTSFDIYDLMIAFAIGLLMIIFWLMMKDKVVAVKLTGQNLIIYQNGNEEIISWLDIISLKQLYFVHPPMYKIRIKDREGYYLFITKPFFISFGFFRYDISEMGSFIRKKKKSLSL